jgi:energy-coupling factor transporter ATP-binding protein EcfA2
MISTTERKERFHKWLSEEKRKGSGDNYSINAVNGYISALTTVPRQLLGVQLEKLNIFDISGADEFQTQWKIMNSASNLQELKEKRRNDDFQQALRLYLEFLRDKGPQNIKDKFFEYIGSEDSLANYNRSYKIVFLISLLNTMDESGKATVYSVANQFRDFYRTRIENGLPPDYNVDSRVANADKSSASEIIALIKDNPYNAISSKGFITIKTFDGFEYFMFVPELVSAMNQEDLGRLREILNKKLNLYFTTDNYRGEKVDLNSIFNQMLDQYYISRTSQSFAGNPMGDLFRNKVVNTIYSLPFIDETKYLVKGAIGQGNWATIPWFSIFDKRITTTAESGIYIVYLLSEDGNSLFITLIQGYTELKRQYGKNQTIDLMQKNATLIREKCASTKFIANSDLSLGSEQNEKSIFYSKGTIYYKEYKKDHVPNNDELIGDLEEMVRIYQQYYDNVFQLNQIDNNLGNSETMPEEDTEPDEIIPIEDIIVSDEITRIAEYISSRGFSYENGLIENFYLSLKTKPFVILAGISGTGKTKLVKLFAEAVGATSENGQYKLVPVRPDWSDSTDLFGHVDLNGNFIQGAIIDFIDMASKNLGKPYFLCLDEMNLARVEYYFSDFLSIIETRRAENAHIITDHLVSNSILGNSEEGKKYRSLYFPENLYIIGTVNMDETTYPFSKKVLDRANTIELSYVELDALSRSVGTVLTKVLPNQFFKSEQLLLNDISGYDDPILNVITLLKQLNSNLERVNSQIGYRVRDEICFYVVYNEKFGLLTQNEAFDNALLQKILPRIQGSNQAIKNLLIDLFKICVANAEDFYQSADNSASESMEKYLRNNPNIPYKKSARKISFMIRRFEEDGYTSYWI